MRSILNKIYQASEYLAAAFLAAIAAMVLAQVGCNVANSIVGWTTGVRGEYTIPSYAEFAGFFLAAASFLALAGTFRNGVHIRVSLIIQNLSGLKRRLVELWCVGFAVLVVGFFAWNMLLLVLESHEYRDMSVGLVPIALWIPQSALALGLGVFLLALLDAFVAVWRGAERAHGETTLSKSEE